MHYPPSLAHFKDPCVNSALSFAAAQVTGPHETGAHLRILRRVHGCLCICIYIYIIIYVMPVKWQLAIPYKRDI